MPEPNDALIVAVALGLACGLVGPLFVLVICAVVRMVWQETNGEDED